ncbi:preprotein translocase subunit SecE [Dehalogenimonas sp. 4OHTPN]|uniref:Protein translocase subunit SecE n=1 Tax=Dehalogenimonas sp. 4OHTPN TaxID=3166643 RepID=A0AAU8G7D7_9CHLR
MPTEKAANKPPAAKPAAPSKPAAAPKPNFFGNIIAELKKVNWPTRDEVRKLTVMVLVVAFTVGLVLGALDYGLSFLVDQFLLD